ncbi:MAG TPA: IS21 family transposase [Ktedonobacterales bacterium]
MNTIRELKVQGKPVRAIARELGLSRNTVRRYLRGTPEAARRPPRASKLDPFKAQIQRWVDHDHLYNCETMLPRLHALGYTGQISILKAFVHPLRPPAAAARQPVIRYETQPGEQAQFDWGEFIYEQEGKTRKVFGFTAVLSFSRLRFVRFVKRTDAATLIRCLMTAFEAFGGLPRTVLTDRMKTVLLDLHTGTPHWHPRFQEFVEALGISPRVCRAYTPQTKGKVERSVGVVKQDFWPGVAFSDLDDLNRQAAAWCLQVNGRVHRTTHRRPLEALAEEGLRPLPDGWAWERFTAEERQVSWDGYISFDGVLYGLPGELALAGRRVQVSEQHGEVRVWRQGSLLLATPARRQSGQVVTHPTQFRSILPAASARRAHVPVGHQILAPTVARRPLADYDWLCGVEAVETRAQPTPTTNAPAEVAS